MPYAVLGAWLAHQIETGDAAFAVLDRQRRTLSNLLGNALDRGLWECAHGIVQPVSVFWYAGGLYEEALGWVDRARLALETTDATPPALDDSAGALWGFFVTAQGDRQVSAHQLHAAEHTYLEIRDMLQDQPESAPATPVSRQDLPPARQGLPGSGPP